ncbi:MAG: DUF488 family protein [Porphyromonadaceae bacterium]|nr:DUF488 family protein [Porphyromonadaceae bacterium]
MTIKRVYDPRSDDDGYRILIDRLWPRGLSKENAHVDLWMKEIAPSTALRKWFHHDTEKWEEFNDLYRKELTDKKKELTEIGILEKTHKKVTLLYSARDTNRNQAVVLMEVLHSL